MQRELLEAEVVWFEDVEQIDIEHDRAVDEPGQGRRRHGAVEPLGVKPRDAERSKNFFALGLISWMYTRPVDATIEWIQKRFEAKQFNDSRRLFDAFIARFPTDGRAATAQYLIGEAYFAEGKYANAIGAYSKVIDNFPKAENVPDAMYRNGLAFYALKYCGKPKVLVMCYVVLVNPFPLLACDAPDDVSEKEFRFYSKGGAR